LCFDESKLEREWKNTWKLTFPQCEEEVSLFMAGYLKRNHLKLKNAR
jgi:hypothetical protein